MDLTKSIDSKGNAPHKIDNGIICFNYDNLNFVYNFPTMFIEKNKQDFNSIGVWKIKQLKK